MDYSERLKDVTVLGAAGKMGSGITLLTAMEMARLAKLPENKGKSFTLKAMDLSEEGLQGLMEYIRKQSLKTGTKMAEKIKDMYPGVEGDEAIGMAYASDVMDVLLPVTTLDATRDSLLIFEAVSENPDLKIKIFKEIEHTNPNKPWYFTNTSSVPISLLNREARLEGRVIGFHFYNPPAVQKLVELINAAETLPEVDVFAMQYAKALRKVVVPSNDFAGFIGNGHFMRDALHGIREAEFLASEYTFPEAVYMVNKVSQQFLIRPMGIFQLIDYVGIDVCQYIMKVMNPYLDNEDLHSPLLDSMMEDGVKGGQHPDGSQKDGFLRYENGKPVAVYDPSRKDYVSIASFKNNCDVALGDLPTACKPWKEVVQSPDREMLLNSCFTEMSIMDTLGAKLAGKYMNRSREIGKALVHEGVARSYEDVNTVLMTGFFHAYGPVNEYLK